MDEPVLYNLNNVPIEYILNGVADEEEVFRILEDGDFRILEDEDFRLLE